MSAPNIDQLLEIAEQAFKSNHLALAESTLSQILQIHSNHSRANEFMAYLHGRNGNMQLAQKFLVQACKQNDCSAIALYELGSLNLENSNLEEAEVYFFEVPRKSRGVF